MSTRAAYIWLFEFVIILSVFASTTVGCQEPQNLRNNIWLSVRTDGKRGTGSLIDPYDGGDARNFDRCMSVLHPNTNIHLGAGTFHTDAHSTWTVKDGWHVGGEGTNVTTIQIVGSLVDVPGGGPVVFRGKIDQNINDFVAKGFTIDCNWANLANSAATGRPIRRFTISEDVVDATTAGSADGQFTDLDIGRCVTGTGIPPNAWIGEVKGPTLIGLSSSAVSNVPLRVTVKKGVKLSICEKNGRAAAAYIYGANNCRFESIRAIHGYGSGANEQESFALGFAPSGISDASGNLITHCLVEQWYGNYANPFALAGFRGSPSYPGVVRWMTNSRVEYCTAIGKLGIVGYPEPGSVTPLTTGGVNLADVKDCVISHNRFEDCQSVAYQDTGGFDGIEISDNTLVRGFQGVVFQIDTRSFPKTTFRNLKIVGNRLGIQRRYTKGANYGVVVVNDCLPVIENNIITYDVHGPGGGVFWPITVAGSGGTIINNTIDGAEYVRIGDAGVTNGVPDRRYRLSNNRTSTGGTIAGMADTP